MQPADLRAIFLTGDRVYLRAFTDDDKHHAGAWAGSPFPIGSPRGEKILADWHKEWHPRARHYALCRKATDDVIGGVTIGIRNLIGEFQINMARWMDDEDALRAETWEVLVPWLIQEWTLVSVTGHVASDQSATRAAAERMGMSHQATLREAIARPDGKRVDDLLYQAFGTMEASIDE